MPAVCGHRGEARIYVILVVTVLWRQSLLYVEDWVPAPDDSVDLGNAVCGGGMLGQF